ncbi:MAG TPA: AarF/ABC1/UbiB kinase family protein [Gemmatimonadaceae bacterium]|jgi:predicted unusual protein kinase regulating ubiquinone biosynthesis (AarF/ABC1/UbiB family)|nr:AarF/ABC1/UbiB kinase family protein [Gemmatimonadaceae bacterium]
MSAGVTGSYLGYLAQSAFLTKDKKASKLRSTHASAARRVSDELSALRGPAMKLGQALSLQTDVLPDEMLAELSRLQMQAPPMHPSLVRAQFKASMGRYPEDVYREFDPVPFAAASLGQVHRCVLTSGENAAVKIQYPGIREAIENDFKWFRAVSKPAQLSAHMPESAIAELQSQIALECDYVREAKNLAYYRKGVAPLGFVDLPRVHSKLSTDKVLTMSMVSGQHLDEFLKTRPSQKQRDLIGERLFELFYFQFFEMHSLHADPHWGNYLFRTDGSIGLIDFGCVKYFPAEFIENMRKIFLYNGRRDTAQFQRLLDERYAGRGARLNPAARRALMFMSENFYGRVYPPDPKLDARPFDFGSPAVVKHYMTQSSKVGTAKGTLPEYIFLARAESGLYQTLHRLRARVHTSAIVRRFL